MFLARDNTVVPEAIRIQSLGSTRLAAASPIFDFSPD
jgi:hypothetical protein